MEKIKRLVLILGLSAAAAYAESPQDLFKQGNASYAAGQFPQAVTAYESAQAQGFQNWVLSYNLGNAYFKSGQTGKAIANYLRAFRLNSSQADVIYNLNLALTKVGDPLVPSESLSGVFWRLFYILSINVLAVLSSALFILFCAGGTLFFLGIWRTRAENAFGALIALLIFGLWFGLRVSGAEKHQGVVVSGTAEVRSAPNLATPANFTVPEGRRVLILEEQEPVKGWMEIGVPQEGLKGWVPDTSVEAV